MGHDAFYIPTGWREPINIVIPCTSRIRKWAFENAWLLIVLAVLFIPTWIALLYVMWKVHGPL